MTDYCSNRIHGSTTATTTTTTASSLNDISPSLSLSSSLLINNIKKNHLSSRIIRMLRPNNSKKLFYGTKTDNYSTFGFSLRGGKEFGVGFFVSKIDKDSEADLKGLKIGDQIIKINGYKVDDATHREITQFISNQDRITLNVRGTDMIPVKEKPNDPLNWHVMSKLISQINLEENNDNILSRSQNDIRRIVIKICPRMKLGLGICKGPEWKPGIFVQFTKEYSVAKNYGLQCGDQILSCNNIDFSNNNVLFSEAVNIMKNSQILELIIRQGAGIDLFPGESSGYNSSASSITGDQSPCYWKNQQRRQWHQQPQTLKRLNTNDSNSMQQKQENHNQLHKFENNSNNLNLSNQNKNFNYENYETINDRNDKNFTNKHNNENNKTIIQLSENGTLINNTLISHVVNENSYQLPQLSSSSSLPLKEENNTQFSSRGFNAGIGATGNSNETNDDICRAPHQNETKSRTVTVEVHRNSTINKKENITCLPLSSSKAQNTVPVSPPEPPPYFSVSTPQSRIVAKESNNDNCSFQDSFNSREPVSCCSTRAMITSTNSSLCNAINHELKKRQERKLFYPKTNHPEVEKSNENEVKRTKQSKQLSNPSVTSYNSSNENMHNALMDEFKRVHRKMFKNGLQDSEINDV